MSLFASCSRALHIEPSWLCCHQDEKAVRKVKEPPASGPALALRIGYAPGVESSGAKLGPFGVGDDVAVLSLERTKGLEPLQWRQELIARQQQQQQQQQPPLEGQGATSSSGRPLWPTEGARFATEQTSWRARVMVSDGEGGFEELWCLLQLATAARERTMESVQAAVDDAVDAAAYAERFNQQTADLYRAEEGGHHTAESVVGIRVCVPVGCFVLGGTAAEVARSGQAVSLALYPFSQVRKLVFDGQDDFSELPQAFFHYAMWRSGGAETLADIQGMEDEDGDIWIVDPVVLRTPAPSVGSLLGALASSRDTKGAEAQERLRLDTWHPKCGQLCKGFDAHRRGAVTRRACGLSVPSCGVGGA